MRVLLLHPEDVPSSGPWSRLRWDLVVDLGKSSRYSEESWALQQGCPVLRSDLFRRGVSDAERVREVLSAGRGRLIDERGIDWWDLTCMLLVPDVLNTLALQRVAEEIPRGAELWSTRAGWPASVVACQLGHPAQSFAGGRIARMAARTGHYAGLLRRFSTAQLREIALDKYDSSYRWRSRFAAKQKACPDPVVLLPSAYSNVSRMAAAYARLLPQQPFLMVGTRQSAKQFTPPSNVQVRDLAAYPKGDYPAAEISSVVERWTELRAELCSSPELRVLLEAGVLDSIPGWFHDGLCARNAWRNVLEREPVSGVLCGDDSNLFTRLPVLLAAREKIPTVDFHHGAFDGRYLYKDLPCDVYMAKSEMEREYLLRVCQLPAEKVVIAAPAATQVSTATRRDGDQGRSVILFSEPYEAVGMRGDEVYHELVPRLLQVARENGRGLIIKLHPFESRTQRRRLVREILGPDDSALVSVLDGPLTSELISQAWFGITVESTTVMDCWQNGVCCFLCGWLTLSPFGYVQQYARFGVGEVLHDLEQIAATPVRVADFYNHPAPRSIVTAAADPALLQRWLTSSFFEPSSARSAS